MPADIPPTSGRSLTPIDEAIASAVYPILVAVAAVRPGRTITYENLILDARQQLAGHEHPIHSQIAQNLGRRLEALRGHTQRYSYPDLSCLVVNAVTGDNPLPELLVRQSHARGFDWSAVAPEFLAELGIDDSTGMPRLRRTEQEARGAMGAHAKEHGKRYHPGLRDCRDEIIAALIRGEDVDAVFTEIDRRLRRLDDQNEYAPA
ncbi:hypothetical protein [Novosphingobium sp. BL-52-GroH]|uniref:hypothetical protein n=1 Tax=Novosphingobium sp. BL-52-GroH TaxID=3349877 RepID=UPI00384CA934